jgi:6-pyruvoyltetrahydropterin/6-carboxytetrahydropterin synthase
MYQISVEQHFDAAHFLRGYQGKCEALHGHRFRVVIKINPSSENIASIIYNELKPKLAGAPVSLSCVEVWESPQSGVTYSPD